MAAKVTQFNHDITRGRSYSFDGTLMQGGSTVSISASDEIKLAAKWNLAEDALTQFECTIGDGITLVDAPNGAINVVISSNKTKDFPRSNERLTLLYEIIYTPVSTGETHALISGKIYVYPSVI